MNPYKLFAFLVALLGIDIAVICLTPAVHQAMAAIVVFVVMGFVAIRVGDSKWLQ